MSTLSPTDSKKLQKKLNTLASMIKAANDVASEIFLTHHDQLMPQCHTNFIGHLLSLADVDDSNRSAHTGGRYVASDTRNSGEDKDTSNSCEEKVMRKRAQSAAAEEEVNGIQDVIEKLAKTLRDKVHHAKKTTTTTITKAKEERKDKEEGEGTA